MALSDETPTNIRIYFIFLEHKSPDLHFPANEIERWNFSGGRRNFCSLWRVGRFGCSRSSKVDKFGANRKRICDFLLVRNSNFGPIVHHFGDLTGFMCSWRHSYSTLILGVFPLHQIADVGRQRAHGPSAIRPWNYFRRIPTYLNTVPDRYGQTDRRTDNLLSHHRALR